MESPKTSLSVDNDEARQFPIRVLRADCAGEILYLRIAEGLGVVAHDANR